MEDAKMSYNMSVIASLSFIATAKTSPTARTLDEMPFKIVIKYREINVYKKIRI